MLLRVADNESKTGAVITQHTTLSNCKVDSFPNWPEASKQASTHKQFSAIFFVVYFPKTKVYRYGERCSVDAHKLKSSVKAPTMRHY